MREDKRAAPFYIGLGLVMAGLAIVGYFLWQYYGTNIVARAEQRDLSAALKQDWADKPGQTPDKKALRKDGDPSPNAVESGDAFALMRIERFGSSYEVPVVKGLDSDALSRGIGWDVDSDRPGQVGNTVYAAHRVTHGEPFRNFPSLQTGDEVEIETRQAIYTYRLQQGGEDWIVDVGDSWVTNPVPKELEDQAYNEAKPNQALITLITCTDLFHSDRRSVVTGTLIDTELK